MQRNHRNSLRIITVADEHMTTGLPNADESQTATVSAKVRVPGGAAMEASA
jgi:hypothetical protein